MNSDVTIHLTKLRAVDYLRTSPKDVLISSWRPHVLLYVTSIEVYGSVHSGITIHKMGFYRIFLFLFPDSNCILNSTDQVSSKLVTSLFRPIVIRNVSTKIGSLGSLLKTKCAGWVGEKCQTLLNYGINIVKLKLVGSF